MESRTWKVVAAALGASLLATGCASAVRDALLAAGVQPERMEVEGYGEQLPIASNDTGEGRQLNRRVEIVISDEAGVIAAR